MESDPVISGLGYNPPEHNEAYKKGGGDLK